MSHVLGAFGAAGFHHVTARSLLARVLKLMNRLFLQFSNFFRAAVSADTEFADTGVSLYRNTSKCISVANEISRMGI